MKYLVNGDSNLALRELRPTKATPSPTSRRPSGGHFHVIAGDAHSQPEVALATLAFALETLDISNVGDSPPLELLWQSSQASKL